MYLSIHMSTHCELEKDISGQMNVKGNKKGQKYSMASIKKDVKHEKDFKNEMVMRETNESVFGSKFLISQSCI